LTVNAVSSSPVAAEVDVPDDLIVRELGADVTAFVVCIGGAKLGRIWRRCAECGWSRSAWEEPHLDKCVGPLHNVCATAVGVEVVAIIARDSRRDGAASCVNDISIVGCLEVRSVCGICRQPISPYLAVGMCERAGFAGAGVDDASTIATVEDVS
jgi:hypothetical protein